MEMFLTFHFECLNCITNFR
ncbi:hypothetical protein AVEN_95037-1, partial [Araneus ventricosus]